MPLQTVKEMPKLERTLTIPYADHADIRKHLQQKQSCYFKESKKHSKAAAYNRLVYYFIGGVTVICSVICTALSAALTAVDRDDVLALVIFVLSLVASAFSAFTNFFGLEEKITKHANTKLQYMDMSREIEVFLLSKRDTVDLYQQEELMLEKEKCARQYEPAISPCFS